MATSELRNLFAAFAIVGTAACGGGVESTGDDVGGDDTVDTGDEWDDRLEERELDYNAALRIAALRLTGELPTLVEIKAVADAPVEQQADVYASILRGYLEVARGAGIIPEDDEHTAILKALKQRNADAARSAMREHLTRVIDALLKATEVQELEKARQQIAEQRKRYASSK